MIPLRMLASWQVVAGLDDTKLRGGHHEGFPHPIGKLDRALQHPTTR